MSSDSSSVVGEMAPALSEQSSSSGEAPSPSKTLSATQPSTPGDSSSGMKSASVVPQNPFEQISSPQPEPSGSTSESGAMLSDNTASATAPKSVTCTGNLNTNETPLSPERSVGSTSSGPSSPIATVVAPQQMSPMPQATQSAAPVMDGHSASLQPRSAPLPPSDVIQGLEHLERQQAASELRQQQQQEVVVIHSSGSSLGVQPTPQEPVFDDDENTEPSSAANTADQPQGESGFLPYSDSSSPQSQAGGSGSFARFLEHTRRRLSSGGRKDSDDPMEDDGLSESALIAGYLQKLGRNGKWQTRWFETDGECLSYYKSSKRVKLLATLDLEKVGAIEIEPDDSKGCGFTIQVLGRPYHLRADSRASCKDWVITLNRVKEARMQQGNVKLVNLNRFQQPPDLLDQSDDMVAPCVVVVANRQRTRAVAESQEWDQLIPPDPDDPAVPQGIVKSSHQTTYGSRRSTIGTVVLARWTKRRSSLSRLGAKLARWARSLRKYGCTEIESTGVHLDRHVHPPGHDDKFKTRPSQPQDVVELQQENPHPEGHGDWIGKETTLSSRSAASDDGVQPIQAIPLVKPTDSPTEPKPRAPVRTMSTGSEQEARYLS